MNDVQLNTPYWRLSAFYFFYFASLGALIPYWNLYLEFLGYSATETGIMLAIIMLTKVIAPNVWGWVADHTGQRMVIVRLGCLFATLTFAGILISQQLSWMILVMLLFSFFWNAALPQFEATTFNHLREQEHRYSSIRLWGSVGFVVAVASLGHVFEVVSLQYLPWFVLVIVAAIWLTSLSVPESAAGHLQLDHEPLRTILKKSHVFGLLLACFLMQASHGPYYAIYQRYMKSFDYSVAAIGWLTALGVIAEVIVFLFMHKLLQRFGLRKLLLFSLLIAVIRWLLIALSPQNMALMLLAQLGHAATFGIYHVTAIRFIHQYFVGPHQGRGQALYSSISFGLGGALGSFYSGFAWDYFGREAVFGLSVVMALLGYIVAYYYVRPEKL